MRQLRCALADIFTRCGTNTVRKPSNIKLRLSSDVVMNSTKESTIPKINYDVETTTERTLGFAVFVKDIIWFVDRLNEFGYDVLSVTQTPEIWKPKEKTSTILVWHCGITPNYYYFKVRKIEEQDLIL